MKPDSPAVLSGPGARADADPAGTGPTLRFYFDYISPNAYIAWQALKPIGESFNLDIRPIPILFAGLLGASGRTGPAEYEPMRRWMFSNVLRKCSILDIPFAPPASHPFNPLALLRLTALDMNECQRHGLIDILFSAVWAKSTAITDPQALLEVLLDGGLDGQSMLAAITTDEAKLRIRNNTDAAIECGVFGVPTMIVDEALFYGYDDFPYMRRLLQGRDPLDHNKVTSWTEVKPSAVRRKKQPDR